MNFLKVRTCEGEGAEGEGAEGETAEGETMKEKQLMRKSPLSKVDYLFLVFGIQMAPTKTLDIIGELVVRLFAEKTKLSFLLIKKELMKKH